MSKFDLMANDELNRFSAHDLDHGLFQMLLADDGRDRGFDSPLQCRTSDWKVSKLIDGIIVNDAAVFLVIAGNRKNILMVRDALTELGSIAESDDRCVIVVDIQAKNIHQVVNINDDMIAIDRGDQMSDELVKLWIEMSRGK